MIDLTNQVALITGGSRGIGAATAMKFAEAGADVAITYRRDKRAAGRIVTDILSSRRASIAVQADLHEFEDCRAVVKRVKSRFGRIDILVNCVGIWEFGPIDRMTPEMWERTINIDLNSVYNMCRVVVPIMKRQKYGRIINVSSTAGQRGEAFYSHYAAAKGGIISFTKSIAIELIPHSIWVNCVAPGWVLTDMTSHVFRNRRVKREILKNMPRRTIPSAQEIAGPIVFLASHLADNIVGEVLNVNGGSVLCG